MEVELEIEATDKSALRLSDYDYDLPPELIAQVPAPRREEARLLVVDRVSGTRRHAQVAALGTFLRRGDLLVFNDTRVRPARLYGRTATGGAVELLLVGERNGEWQALGKPAKRLREGVVIQLGQETQATIACVLGGGRYVVRFDAS